VVSGEEIFKSICKVLEEIAEKITGIEEEILRQREKNITSSNNELLDYLNRTINL
jgi:Mg2+ and Co2+ transporter CorA